MTMTKDNLKRKNFAPDDFFSSDTAYRINHDANLNNDFVNYPSKSLEQSILPCLMNTADMMQEIRDLLKCPVKINSAYRCKVLNDLVGSYDLSQHMQGLAVDFTAAKFGSPESIVKFLHSCNFLADQCLVEGSWVHISRTMVKTQNRMMYGFYLLNAKTNKREFVKL